jgi:crossover junction endodeoxyribonuclease RuvC
VWSIKTVIISIDPGLGGAIAVLFENGDIYAVHDMPISAKTNGKGNQVNAALLSEILGGYVDLVDKVIIERVHAMPGQGVTSVFGFGRSLGVVEGVCAALGFSVEWITPQKWKKKFSLIGKDKDAARTFVIEKYPNELDLFKRKKDIGGADAVLIGSSVI